MRKEPVDLVMRRAYRKRDVETFVWACLKLTEEEIKGGIKPRERTFAGREIVGFVNTLVSLEKVRKEGGKGKDENVDMWGDWNSNEGVTETGAEVQ